jgi:hypothetical protein
MPMAHRSSTFHNMNNPTATDWISGNQQYLSVAIQGIKLRLEIYADQVKGQSAKESLQAATDEVALQALRETLPMPPALEQVCDTFQLSAFERQMLLLCAAVELDADMARMVQDLQGEGRRLPTFGLALALFEPLAHWSALSPEAPLRYWELIDCDHQDILTRAACRIDEQVLHFLTGVSYLAPPLGAMLQTLATDEQAALAHPAAAGQLTRLCAQYSAQGNYPVFQIQGGSVSEQGALCAGALLPFKVKVYQLNPALLPLHFQELSNLSKRWNRSAALQHLGLFIDLSQWHALDFTQQRNTLFFLENTQGIICYGADLKLNTLQRAQISIRLEALDAAKQQALWHQELGATAALLNGALEQVSTQFQLDAGGIRQLSAQVNAAVDTSSESDSAKIKQALWQACLDYTRPNLEQLAQRIEPVATWNDLVLPEPIVATLKEIALHVRQRATVYGTWGFAGKSARGLGISALFSGESGTGKTMASEVIANELGLDLYRIDLSQVVNKYIGETEKNLKKIFEAAEGSGAILLFDEADALFGKRSDVKDSHDRYSNIEVSYLLQKMEEYRGLAILTTNMRSALDKAFLRRIRFVVQFPFPDVSMRHEIWQKVFPKQTPLAALDFQKLAALNIAGGNIRNIALNAAFSAAGEQRAVGMVDLQQAARNEYLKLEKHMSASESLL